MTLVNPDDTARQDLPGHEWIPATLVARRPEVPGTSSLLFDAPGMSSALAGQHVDIRLTAEDGYTAQRSYSMSSPAGADQVEVTVDLIADGEVSPYLVGEIEPGDPVEIRGPIGLWFVWRPEQTEPVTLVAGGSGIVPLMSMIRTRRDAGTGGDFRLLYSTHSRESEIFGEELHELARTTDWFRMRPLYTREAPADDPRGARRINREDVELYAHRPDEGATVYACGPTPFVEVVARCLTDLGHDAARVRTERFGASG